MSSTFAFRPTATRRCEPSTASPPFVITRIAPAAPETSTTSAPSRIRTPSSRSAAITTAAASGSSLPSAFAPSITVTAQPSRRCACAISIPMGPPPMTMRCAGFSRRSKIVSFVK